MKAIRYNRILNEQNLSSLTSAETDLFFGLFYMFQDSGRNEVKNLPISIIKKNAGKEKWNNENLGKNLESLMIKLKNIDFIENGKPTRKFDIFKNLKIVEEKLIWIERNEDFLFLFDEGENKREGSCICKTDVEKLVGIKGKHAKTLYRLLSNFDYNGFFVVKGENLIKLFDFNEEDAVTFKNTIRYSTKSLSYIFQDLTLQIKKNKIGDEIFDFRWKKRKKEKKKEKEYVD